MKHTIILPDLGQTTSEAKVIRWLKSVGDKLTTGEPLLEVETDKATMDVEAYVGGYLRKRLAQEGEMAAAMSPVAILTDTQDEIFEEEAGSEEQGSAEPVADAARQADISATPAQNRTRSTSGPIAAAPAARFKAKELGVELSQITGTGPNGLITKQDVERFVLDQPESSSSTSDDGSEAKWLAAMAAVTMKSKSTIPHFYATLDLDVSAMEAWRHDWNKARPKSKVSLNDCLVFATMRALADSPRINVRYSDGRYLPHGSSDVLLVVGREAGLMLVPVASEKDSLPALASRIRAGVEAARQGRMSSTDGTVSPALAVSNLGMFGVKEFSAIIPPGCSSILAVGAVRDHLVLSDGQLVNNRICSVTVSADHRVIDGIAAARFLERLQFHINGYESFSPRT